MKLYALGILVLAIILAKANMEHYEPPADAEVKETVVDPAYYTHPRYWLPKRYDMLMQKLVENHPLAPPKMPTSSGLESSTI